MELERERDKWRIYKDFKLYDKVRWSESMLNVY